MSILCFVRNFKVKEPKRHTLENPERKMRSSKVEARPANSAASSTFIGSGVSWQQRSCKQSATGDMNALRLSSSRAARRTFSSTVSRRREEVVGTVGPAPVPRPVGGFRGGILGFFFGFSAATAFGLYYLQQENKVATGLLLASVEELQQGTGKITSHLDRLQSVEKELANLKAAAAVKEDVNRNREEMKRVYDGLHIELLDLRAHVWGVEQDLQKVVRTESIRI